MTECRIKFDLPLPNGKRLERVYRATQYPAAKGERPGVSAGQASNCCQAQLKAQKKCLKCGGENPWNTEWRLVKVGAGKGEDAYKALEKRRFKEIDELLPETRTFVVKSLRAIAAVSDADDRVDRTLYLGQVAKAEAEYCEAVAVLRGMAAVGSMTLGSNNYEGVLDVVSRNGAEFLRLRLLVLEEQYNGVPQVERVEVAPAKVELLRKVLGSATEQEQYDFSQFQDIAVVKAEELVMKAAMGEPLPEIKQEAVAQKAADEEAELKALAEGLL